MYWFKFIILKNHIFRCLLQNSCICRKSSVHIMKIPFKRVSGIDCLVDRKRNLSSLVTVANQGKHCMTCFIFSRKIEVCCNRIRDVVREKYICSKILARVLSGKRCVARQLSNSQHISQEFT